CVCVGLSGYGRVCVWGCLAVFVSLAEWRDWCGSLACVCVCVGLDGVTSGADYEASLIAHTHTHTHTHTLPAASSPAKRDLCVRLSPRCVCVLSGSLSLTHTHTHTHTEMLGSWGTGRRGERESRALYIKYLTPL